ncbi:MAG: choice-of-anchor D domain-containing protein, partial [Spirochaetes bacterium]|nr:choice-of-anchor D domain-containing protein [Spirochaetota bacterium]
SPVAAGGSTTFTITFNPGSVGAKSAAVSIANNDLNENPYTFSLSGAGTVPDMNVKQGISNIASSTGSFDFVSVLSGTPGSPVTFTIENFGEAALNLIGGTRVEVTGTDATMFDVTAQPDSPIAYWGSTTFAITFKPTSTGPKTATVSIANDDPDENPYTFTVTGEGGTDPEINVFTGSTDIHLGGSYGFGDVILVSGGSSVSFSVENLGTADLTLSGSPKVAISGTHAAMFVVAPHPTSPIVAGGSRAFTITFTPTSAGLKSATVSISNDDPDENPYTFSLTGTGTGTTPEINVKQGVDDIPDGMGSYDFHDVGVAVIGGFAVTFTIENQGTANLTLTGTTRVLIDGTDAGLFTVDAQPSSPIEPSSSVTFTITFDPDSLGPKTATVTIVNNDLDESSYTFTILGTGS